MGNHRDRDIALNPEIQHDRIQVFPHKDLNEAERRYLRDGIRALEEFNEKEVGRRELTDEQIDYLLNQENRFTLIYHDPEGNYSYSIYAKARNGETVFLEAFNQKFDTTLPDTSTLMKRYEEREGVLRERAIREANSRHFRNYAPIEYSIPEVIYDQNDETVVEIRGLVKATGKNGENFIKIPNGQKGVNVSLNFSNEPSTDELESFLTDELIAQRVLYSPLVDISDDYTDGEKCVPGYIFVCEDQPNDASEEGNFFRNSWEEGKFIRMIDGMPQISRSSILPSGLMAQEIVEETCPVTFAFLENYRKRMSQTSLSQGEEVMGFSKKPL